MAVPNTPNADLEQALFKANQKEKRLRRRATFAALLPLVAGFAWLGYSFLELTTWQSRGDEIAAKETETQQREKAAQERVAAAEVKLATTEGSVQAFQQQEKAASERATDIRQRLVKVREEIGGLGALLTDLNAAKAKASKLMASEAVESQLTDIRTALSRSLARVEQEIDQGLPAEEQKARIYIFIPDESQSAAAKELVPVLEGAGFDVASISKNTTRRVEESEVRYFRDPQDKADATRIQDLFVKQTGHSDCKIIRTSDPENAAGSRKFQVWFAKPAPVGER